VNNKAEISKRKKDSARLVWDSKPRRAPNPRDIEFQTAEIVVPNPERDLKQLPIGFTGEALTVGEPGQLALGESERQRGWTYDPRDQRPLRLQEIDKTKMNRLIWGDNLLAMQALLAQGYEGKIQLIYIDPPFDSKADYSHRLTIEGEEITKEPSVIERLAYKDTWSGGVDTYLDMLFPRVQLMRRLLCESGSLFVHCDWHVGDYIKVLLDEVFGYENFVNEIVINRGRRKNLQKQFTRISSLGQEHETLLVYRKTPAGDYPLVKSSVRSSEAQWQSFWRGNVQRPTMQYDLLGFRPTRGQFLWSKERAYAAVENYKGFLESGETDLVEYWGKTARHLEFVRLEEGKSYPQYWIPPKSEGIIGTDWTDIQSYSYSNGFETEKHLDLLTRVIEMGSQEGDLAADFFVGSGTTLAVAEELDRRWLGCELGKVGIQVTRSRLVNAEARPFLVENIGNYQREMIYLSGGRINEMLNIILKLFGATPRKDYQGLGVRRSGDVAPGFSPANADLKVGATGSATEDELVFVGYPDRPVTARRVEEIAKMADKLDGRGYRKLIVLAWDYDYNYPTELEKRLKSLGEKSKVKVESRMIPPDIYEHLKKAKDESDIEPLRDKVKFYEKPYLKLAEPQVRRLKDNKAEVTIGLARYVLFDFPVEDEEEQAKLRKLAKDNFAVFIDYWAIDWDYDGLTFKSLWQDIRGNGRKTKVVSTSKAEVLETGKKRTIAVRVVDVFGNDAAATVEVELR
jgi:DNA modification methylase